MNRNTGTENKKMGDVSPAAAHRFVKDMGGRRIIFNFSGKDKMTDLLICYAERKASLRF